MSIATCNVEELGREGIFPPRTWIFPREGCPFHAVPHKYKGGGWCGSTVTEGGRKGTYGRCQVGSGGSRAGDCTGHLEHWQSPKSQLSSCHMLLHTNHIRCHRRKVRVVSFALAREKAFIGMQDWPQELLTMQ